VYGTASEFDMDTARILRDTGQPDRAKSLFTGALARYPTWQTRRRALVHIDLGLTHVARGDLDKDGQAWLLALADRHVTDSTKGRDRLLRLHRTLAPHRRASGTAALDAQLTVLFKQPSGGPESSPSSQRTRLGRSSCSTRQFPYSTGQMKCSVTTLSVTGRRRGHLPCTRAI
jgi:hypothetical protein